MVIGPIHFSSCMPCFLVEICRNIVALAQVGKNISAVKVLGLHNRLLFVL